MRRASRPSHAAGAPPARSLPRLERGAEPGGLPPGEGGGDSAPEPMVRHDWRALAATGAVSLGFAWLAWVVLDPDAVYTIDTAIKYIQARTLWESRWLSQSFVERAAYIDPGRDFLALERPFVFPVRGRLQSIFPTAWAALTAPLSPWGLAGITAASLAAAAALMWQTYRLGRGLPHGWLLPALMGLATVLWFYAVVPSEHALAAALGAAGIHAALARPGIAGSVRAGLLCGLAALFRDELLLIWPGLAYAGWLVTRERRAAFRAAFASGASVAGVLAAAGLADVALYRRPLAAHLQHALGSLAGWLPGPTAPAIPYLEDLGPADRLEIVAGHWLVGVADVPTPVLAGLAVAVALWRAGARGRPVVSAVALLVLSVLWAADALRVLAAPRFVGGLLRLSPFLAFAIVPLPAGAAPSNVRRVALATSAAYLGIALLTLNTAGGKALGPRLLLVLLPLLTVAAWEGISRWHESRRRGAAHRAVAWLGLFLAGGSAVLQIGGPLRGYVGRTRTESAAVGTIAALGSRAPATPIIVLRDTHDLHVTAARYFDGVVMAAPTQARAAALAERFLAAHVPGFVLVHDAGLVPFAYPGYTRTERAEHGRWVIERWSR